MQVISKKYTLLKPVLAPPRLSSLSVVKEVKSLRDLDFIVTEHPGNEWMAIDFETRGVDPLLPECGVVGVSLADSRGSIYVSLKDLPGAYEHLMRLLDKHRTPLIAHNIFFDAQWPLANLGLWLNWQLCTYAVFRLTATEGFFGQSWGLKQAQIDFLGWEEKGDVELDTWLIDHGFVQNVEKQAKKGYYFREEWPRAGKPEPRWVKPNKGEMWQAPAEILGHYGALDADSTYLLWEHVLKPVVNRFSFLRTYIYEWYPRYMELLVRQRLRGILIDKEGTEAYLNQLKQDKESLEREFFSDPAVQIYLAERLRRAVDEHLAKEPAKFKLVKLGQEPAQFTSKGEVSKNWLKWKEKAETPPVLSKNWVKWQQKMDAIQAATHFNLNSAVQLREFFYEYLNMPKEVWTKPSKEFPEGAPSTSKMALLTMGPLGAKLLEIKDKEKMKQFCVQTLSLLVAHEDGTHTVHPGWSVPGTLTGRLSGKTPNCQQVPKDGNFLRHWKPREGFILVDNDHFSVEPVVLTELSKCPGMMKIYGPEAKPNCIYLYAGSHFPNEIGQKIVQAGYVREGMSEALLDEIKSKCKAQRKPAKRYYLAWGYGAGTNKLQFGFKMDGFLLSLEDVQKTKDAMDTAFPGVALWAKELERQWKKNSGWLLNGLGRPIGVDQEKRKDLKNRVVQSTAHDIHIKYILLVMEMLVREGIEWYPFIVDFHDQMIVECRPEDAERVKQIMGYEAYDALNEWLGGEVKLKGDPQIIKNLAFAKVEKWQEHEEAESFEQEEEEVYHVS